MPTDEITIDDLVNWLCEERGIVLWKDIPGYEGMYEASNVGGMVRNKTTCRTLKPKTNKGYLGVNLCKNSTVRQFLVHRLVAKTWVPNPHNYQEVNHIDEVKISNNAANLEWCDRRYNCNWGTHNERVSAKLREVKGVPVNQFTLDGKLLATYRSQIEAGELTGVNSSSISYCCKGTYKTAGGYIWKFQE